MGGRRGGWMWLWLLTGCLEATAGESTAPQGVSRQAATAAAAVAPTDNGSLAGTSSLASIGRQAMVYATPSRQSKVLGYLRAGSVVRRSSQPQSRTQCPGGWYRIEPRGYVCVDGQTATLDVQHPVVALLQGGSDSARERAERHGLPYDYAIARYPTPPFYGQLPSMRQQKQREPDLRKHRRRDAARQKKASYVAPAPAQQLPPSLAAGRFLPGLDGVDRKGQWNLGRARRRSGFAIAASYDHDGRRFGLTTDLVLLPLDRTRMVRPPSFRGLKIDGEMQLPVAFVKVARAPRYRPRGRKRMRRLKTKLARRTPLNLSGKVVRRKGHRYLEMSDGDYVRADHVVRISRFRKAPAWARRGDKWIDISLINQTLVAYHGRKPVFATLVSTGADGLAKHHDSTATIQGTFLIHTKHVTATMDSDAVDSRFRLAAVPFVQYFTKGYALHAAYWHNDFGRPRSHGCINLSPADAQFLFGFSDPPVPKGWHAALARQGGTLVHIHP